ncbi:succinylglutamate desuccinylase/aspartoacylase family protein [Tamilnaduibacter salinus]|nr:succinylglutamate desuccinylase/aspartoacylase family protein [Tamilnaduibacter salinus]
MVRTVSIATILALGASLPAWADTQPKGEADTEPAKPAPAAASDEGTPKTGANGPAPSQTAETGGEERENATVVAPDVDLKDVAPDPAAPTSSASAQGKGDDDDTTAKADGDDNAPGTSTTEASTEPDSDPTLLPEGGEPELVLIDPVEAPKAESLVMLGAEVRPGTSTRLTWQPDTTMAGLTTPTPVLVLNGAQPGPNLCLTAAVHGDELNGIEIVRRVMYTIEPENLSGRIIGVPIVNVQGFRRGSRYLADRRDLNRHFPGDPDGSLASRIAHSLFTDVIQTCDMLVDIHTGSLKRTNLPQMRADMNRPEVATFSRGFDEMAVVHSPGSEGMLRVAASNAGITAITMEAGESTRFQQHQIEAGVNAINSLLEKQNMLNRLFVWGEPEPVYYDSSWVRANHGGILNSDVDLGDDVVAGQPLGTVTDPITNAQHTIRADEDGRVIGMAVDQVVMAGFAAYHLGTAAQAPEVAE